MLVFCPWSHPILIPSASALPSNAVTAARVESRCPTSEFYGRNHFCSPCCMLAMVGVNPCSTSAGRLSIPSTPQRARSSASPAVTLGALTQSRVGVCSWHSLHQGPDPRRPVSVRFNFCLSSLCLMLGCHPTKEKLSGLLFIIYR